MLRQQARLQYIWRFWRRYEFAEPREDFLTEARVREEKRQLRLMMLEDKAARSESHRPEISKGAKELQRSKGSIFQRLYQHAMVRQVRLDAATFQSRQTAIEGLVPIQTVLLL